MTTVYFVRHAQTDYSNPIDKDRPLTAEGMQDRYLARDYMVKQGLIGQLTHIYASNFRRAADTVWPIAEAAGLPVEEKEEFREWTLLAKGEEYYSISRRAWEDFTYRYETCETLQEVQARNLQKLRELVAEHPGETIVIGTHGTALSTIIHYYKPDYGYEEFLKIMEFKPWIVRFQYDGEQLISIEECFRNDLNMSSIFENVPK